MKKRVVIDDKTGRVESLGLTAETFQEEKDLSRLAASIAENDRIVTMRGQKVQCVVDLFPPIAPSVKTDIPWKDLFGDAESLE